MAGWVLGVDFGTSNTAAAHTGVRTGAIETLPLTHSGNLMSSSVFVESPDSIMVGDVAINRAEMNPAAFIPSPKRVVGQAAVNVNGYDVAPAVPVAAVLRVVLNRAVSAHGGELPDQLVLTHPEAWSPNEIGVLFEAAQRAGVNRSQVRVISEPRAAAHYYTRARRLDAGSRIAVFDFGGGTLDIAVLEADTRGAFSVVAARGDNGLGGKNFDALIRRWVDGQLEDRDPQLLSFLRQDASMGVLRNLEDSIRRAKELLSEAPSASITVMGNGRQETLLLTRGEFEGLIDGEIDRAVNLARGALGDAGAGALRAIYLTGGSSRVPLVHDRLRPLGPVATLDDPKTVVVQGALMATGELPVQQSQPPHAQQHPTPSYVTQPQMSAPRMNTGSVPQTPRHQPAPAYPTAPAPFAARTGAPAASRQKSPTMVAAIVTAVVVLAAVLVALATSSYYKGPVHNSFPASQSVAPLEFAATPQKSVEQ